MDKEIQIGKAYRFAYPDEFTTLEPYSQHRGQVVTVLRELGPDENDNEEKMFEIKAEDGWVGHAFDSELEELPNG